MTFIQSIIFNKSNITLPEAKRWLKSHGFKYDLDEKKKTYRFRQVKPNKKFKYVTKTINENLKLIIGLE